MSRGQQKPQAEVTRNVRHFEPSGVPVLNPFLKSEDE